MKLEEALTTSVFDTALLHLEFESYQVMRNCDVDTKERRPYRWCRIPSRMPDMPIEPPLPKRLETSEEWEPLQRYSV